jgi:hypothetical protein
MENQNGNTFVEWAVAGFVAVLTWKFLTKKAKQKKIENHDDDERRWKR